MAEHGAFEVDTATGVDYEEHQQTYRGFLRGLRYGVIAIVLLLIFLAWWTY
jgi:hypothetical protein